MATKKVTMREAHEVSGEKDRKVALDTALSKIKKQFGDGAVMRMGDKSLTNIDVSSTGILSLDISLRVLSIRIEKKVNYFYEVTTSD